MGNNDHYRQLELDPDEGLGIYERMTLTYGLGDQHGLFESMKDSYTLTWFSPEGPLHSDSVLTPVNQGLIKNEARHDR